MHINVGFRPLPDSTRTKVMPIQMTLKAETQGVAVKLWTDTARSEALEQLKNVARLPITYSHVAAMPDVHYGRGATVGSVIATHAAIIPAAVGVDIGCGMHAVRLDLEADRLPDNLRPVREAIETRVPLGFARHTTLKRNAARRAQALEKRVHRVLERTPEVAKRRRKLDEAWRLGLGTLGGGNHFIELCLDEADRVWLMLHSGSRTLGAAIGEHFIQSARVEAERLDRRLPDRDLGWLEEGTDAFDRYWEALTVAQDYAHENRRAMTEACLDALAETLPEFGVTDEAIECHDNYASREQHAEADVFVTRKGAISARAGELGIVPGSMGTHSYIVRGQGNRESFHSCAHGAGRRMSRGAAKRQFTTADVAGQTAGIECRKDAGVIDEIPGAYKAIDDVMERQNDLALAVHKLRQVLNVKG